VVELSRGDDQERWDKLDQRLEKIMRKIAKVALVNMAKTIENAMRDCIEKMVGQIMDQVVAILEKLAEKENKEEIRRRNQVEATTDDEDIKEGTFSSGTFLREEDEWTDRILKEMEVEVLERDQSRHAPTISPRGKKQEFPRFVQGDQVMIVKKQPLTAALLQMKKKVEAKKPEVKETLKRPRAGMKGPEVKKPLEKKLEKTLAERIRKRGRQEWQQHHHHQRNNPSKNHNRKSKRRGKEMAFWRQRQFNKRKN
jgi:hypothetical protein